MDVVETDRLVLRHQGAEDAPFIRDLLNDPDWLRHIGDRGVRTVSQARAYIAAGPVAMYARHGFGLYIVETQGDRVPVGICGLVKRDALADADLGFALTRGHRGNGYAREAAAATMAYARTTVGLSRLAATVSPGNTASIRLLEALGFAFEREVESPGGGKVRLLAVDLR